MQNHAHPTGQPSRSVLLPLIVAAMWGGALLHSPAAQADAGPSANAALADRATPRPPIGRLRADQDLPAEAGIRLRILNRQGKTLESHVVRLSTAGSRESWLQQLAAVVNHHSAHVRVGNRLGRDVAVPEGTHSLDVFAFSAEPGLHFALDTSLPPEAAVTTGIGTNGGGSSGTGSATSQGGPAAWTEGKAYLAGQVVLYRGLRYRCLQNHTAWQGAGWYPSMPGVVNVLWEPL